MKNIMNGMERDTNFTREEKVRLYLERHPEVFTDDFMEMLADRYLNCNTIRRTFKDMYPAILIQDIIPNLHVIPNDI